MSAFDGLLVCKTRAPVGQDRQERVTPWWLPFRRRQYLTGRAQAAEYLPIFYSPAWAAPRARARTGCEIGGIRQRSTTAPVRALMKCRSRWFKFDLPDEWWAAAGMAGFVTSRTAYRRNAVRRAMILRIDEIAVPPRGAGVPDFERDRMVSLLDAIHHDRTLPPIEVVEAISD
jgi:hypothetical protein